jgi:hypothetical protein
MSTATIKKTADSRRLTAGIMPTESIRGELLRRVSVLSSNDCTKVLHFIDSLETEWSVEEWDALCEEFEHSPEQAVVKAERRAGLS